MNDQEVRRYTTTMLADLSALTSAELISRVRSTRESIAELTSMNFEMLEELRARVGEEGGLIQAGELIAVVAPLKEVKLLDHHAIKNTFTAEEMEKLNFIKSVIRRQAIRIFHNPSLSIEEE